MKGPRWVGPANGRTGAGCFNSARSFWAALPERLTDECIGQLGLPIAAYGSALGPSECGRRAFPARVASLRANELQARDRPAFSKRQRLDSSGERGSREVKSMDQTWIK